VAGSTAVRENEISKEIDIRQVGAICLSCGHRQDKATEPARVRQLPPIAWEPAALMGGDLPVALSLKHSIVQNDIEQRTVDLQSTL
jgi:hypothetical protein